MKIACYAFIFRTWGNTRIIHGTVWHLTAFASTSLTAADQNHSQIEKEILSTLSLCEGFHEYVCGLRFVVANDHEPLISIFP